MSQFNPQDPYVQDPNYMYWTKPIEQPKANTSKEVALKGAGNVFGEAVSVGNLMAEQQIKGEVREQAEPVTDEFVRRASAVNAAVSGETGPWDVLSGNKDKNNLPDDLKSLPGKNDTLLSARANGKLSPSSYDAQIYSIAKNLRNKYPSYRDYIDEQMYKATGVHPANQLVRSLIQDYNTSVANANQAQNKLETEAFSVMGYPGVQGAYNWWRADQNNSTRQDNLRDAIAAGKGIKNTLEASDLKFRNAKAMRENTQGISEDSAARVADNTVSASMGTLILPIGDHQSWSEYQQKLDKGYQPGPEESEMMKSWLGNEKSKQEAFLRKVLSGQEGLLPNKRDEIIKSALEPYDTRLRLFENGEHGLASHADRMVKAKLSETRYNWSQTSNSELFRRVEVISDIFGKNSPYTSIVLQNLTGQLQSAAGDFAVQQLGNVLGPQSPDKQPVTLNSMFQDWSTHLGQGPGRGPGGLPAAEAAHNAQMFKNTMDTLYHMMWDKGSPDKAKVAAAATLYNQDNQLLLDYFQRDRVSIDGRFIPGANSQFKDMYGPRSADAIRTKSPDQWDNFKHNAEFQGGKLIRDDLTELSSKINGLPPGALSWDSDAHRWDIHSIRTPGQDSTRFPGQFEDASIKVARSSVENINKVVETLSNIYGREGEDVDKHVMQFLMNAGYPDTPMAKALGDLVIASHKKQKASSN